MRAHPIGARSAIIGKCVEDHPGMVVARTDFSATRIVDTPLGEQLPRICCVVVLGKSGDRLRFVPEILRATWRRTLAKWAPATSRANRIVRGGELMSAGPWPDPAGLGNHRPDHCRSIPGLASKAKNRGLQGSVDAHQAQPNE
jgi:hypothetical protein